MNKSTVLSVVLRKSVPGLLENHAAYAHRHGYRHQVVDLSHLRHDELALIAKWQAIYDAVVEQHGGAVLVLTERALVYRDQALPDVFGDVPYYLSGVWGAPEYANTDAFYLTADGGVQAAVFALFEAMRAMITRIPVASREDAWLQEAMIAARHLAPLGVNLLMGEVAPLASVSGPGSCLYWGSASQLPAFVCTIGQQISSSDERPVRGVEDMRLLPLLLHDVAHAHGFLAAAFDAAHQPPTESVLAASDVHLHPQAAVGVVSCYTPNISAYAVLHERSWLPYCQAQGLGYHLYRQDPDGLPEGVKANWAKAHLLLRHLEDHEWVFWVDADVLVQNPDFALQGWLAGRERVVATDHCNFPFNSGVMGFARTEANVALLREVADRIEALADKSNVYASGGDQQIFNEVFRARGLLQPHSVASSLLAAHVPHAVNLQAWTWHCPALLPGWRRAAMQWKFEQLQAAFPGHWQAVADSKDST